MNRNQAISFKTHHTSKISPESDLTVLGRREGVPRELIGALIMTFLVGDDVKSSSSLSLELLMVDFLESAAANGMSYEFLELMMLSRCVIVVDHFRGRPSSVFVVLHIGELRIGFLRRVYILVSVGGGQV